MVELGDSLAPVSVVYTLKLTDLAQAMAAEKPADEKPADEKPADAVANPILLRLKGLRESMLRQRERKNGLETAWIIVASGKLSALEAVQIVKLKAYCAAQLENVPILIDEQASFAARIGVGDTSVVIFHEDTFCWSWSGTAPAPSSERLAQELLKVEAEARAAKAAPAQDPLKTDPAKQTAEQAKRAAEEAKRTGKQPAPPKK